MGPICFGAKAAGDPFPCDRDDREPPLTGTMHSGGNYFAADGLGRSNALPGALLMAGRDAPSSAPLGPMGPMLVTWLPILTATALLFGCAEQPAPLYGGTNGPPDELVLQECRGEVAKAQMSASVPEDVRAEVARGVMASCMAKKGFYLQ